MLRSSRTLGSIAVLALVAALGAQQAPAPAGAKGSQPAGAISGVVSDKQTGRGIAGVVVSLTGSGRQQATITDSKGRFVFDRLPASDRYYLLANKPGYVAGGIARRNFATGTAFALAEDEWIADANIVMSRLGSISGAVLDEHGEPAVNIPVRLLTRVSIAGTAHWATGPMARTDDRGVYRIANVMPGTYLVNVPSVQSTVPHDTSHATILGLSAEAAARRALPDVAGMDAGDSWRVIGLYATPPTDPRRGYAPLFYPGSVTIAAAATIEIGAAEVRSGIDFVLSPVPTVGISGRVTGPPQTVAKLVVRLLLEGGETMGAGSEVATALVEADGRFSLAGVPAGRYILDARTGLAEINVAPTAHLPATPGFVDEQGFVQTISSLPNDGLGGVFRARSVRPDAWSARVPIVVGPDEIRDVELTLERGARISGRIMRDDGRPLPAATSARVSVEPASGDPGLGIRTADVSSVDGTFVVSGLFPGDYLLRVSAADLRVKSITTADGDRTNRPLAAAPDQDVAEVVVTLTEQFASVSGTVRDRQGDVVREAAVILFPADRDGWMRFGLTPRLIRSTTYLGTGYNLTRLVAGDYYIIAVDASLRDAWQDPRFFPAAATVATRVRLDWNATVTQGLVLQQVVLK